MFWQCVKCSDPVSGISVRSPESLWLCIISGVCFDHDTAVTISHQQPSLYHGFATYEAKEIILPGKSAEGSHLGGLLVAAPGPKPCSVIQVLAGDDAHHGAALVHHWQVPQAQAEEDHVRALPWCVRPAIVWVLRKSPDLKDHFPHQMDGEGAGRMRFTDITGLQLLSDCSYHCRVAAFVWVEKFLKIWILVHKTNSWWPKGMTIGTWLVASLYRPLS